jgi:cell division protein FtsB
MKEDYIFYIGITSCILLVAVGAIILNVIIVSAALLIIGFLTIVYKAWYLIEAIVFSHTNIVERYGSYELSGERNTAIIQNEGNFTAIAAALVTSVSRHPTQQEFESMISKIDFPFSFATSIKRADSSNLLKSLQTRYSMLEIKLDRLIAEGASQRKISSLKREMAILEEEIKTMQSGKQLKLYRFISTYATSQSKIAAQAKALSQLDSIMSGFSVLLGAKLSTLSGSELAKAIMGGMQ